MSQTAKGKLIRIHVNQDDIYLGIMCNCQHCPIGCSIRRKYPEVEQVSVAPGFTYFDGIRFLNPPELSKYVIDFDCGRKVEPRTFFLEQQTPGTIGGLV